MGIVVFKYHPNSKSKEEGDSANKIVTSEMKKTAAVDIWVVRTSPAMTALIIVTAMYALEKEQQQKKRMISSERLRDSDKRS